MKFKIYVKILAVKITWFLSKIFWILPLDNNKLFFSSFDGKQYSDSPKYISDYMLKKYPELKIVWGFNKTLNLDKTVIDPKIICCKKGTIKYYINLYTSKQIITNDFISTTFKLRENQILLNTWHGGGTFKTIGMTRKDVTAYDKFFYEAHANNTSAFLLSSEYFKDTVVSKSFLFSGETIKSGLPRNAILFSNDLNIKRKVLNTYGIDDENDAMVVLYAPTYRNFTLSNNVDSKYEFLDFDKCKYAFEQKFKKNVIMLNRSHHAMNNVQIKGCYIDATNYPDMQELLIAADVLISDYSSCMWDYSIMKKPIFLYVPDLLDYKENIDFFMSIDKWAFSKAYNNEELINNIMQFEANKYQIGLNEYLEPLVSYENKNSIAIVCEWLNSKRC